ncbi:unnamed protein product [Chironomus riparius]|uniref:Triokinase/FMN cyclase n=1 Tax=Chironomus riparius TaxID=315576 RepID=A0A9N9RY80_9DIPT|nr:unnamed protein product [Chironomus riparius]
MVSVGELSLRNTLLGFVGVHSDILHVKSHNILLRDDEEFRNDKKSVLIISGGGSGHEPFPVGFVGKGMLSAAICGEIFTSPSVTSCLASILLSSQNDPSREILMVINNYTGDRLNFGLAIEMARNIHKYENIKSIIIDDDCAIDNPRNSTGRRGLTAINLIMKIAGAMSAKGFPLTDIHEQCSSILNNRMIRTIGFTFQHNRNELNQIDIGYGIHGEAGALKLDNTKCFKTIIGILKQKLKIDEIKSDIIVLFNNLGGASEFIFYNFIKDFMDSINGNSFNVIKIYAGKFLTSLGKEGIGVSIMEIKDNSIIELLEHPTETASKYLFNIPLSYSHSTREMDFEVSKVDECPNHEDMIENVKMNEIEIMKKVLMKICHDINDARSDLNLMDKELGDSDTGDTLSRGACAILRELSKNNLNAGNPHKFLITLSDILMRSMGGSSGAIFSIFFQCASIAFRDCNKYCITNWLQALSNGIDGIMRYGKAEIGDRTLLDSLCVGYNEMKITFNDGNSLEAVQAFTKGCQIGCDKTKNMFPKSGRCAYAYADKDSDFKFSSKFPDSGAYVISIISNGILHVLQGLE